MSVYRKQTGNLCPDQTWQYYVCLHGGSCRRTMWPLVPACFQGSGVWYKAWGLVTMLGWDLVADWFCDQQRCCYDKEAWLCYQTGLWHAISLTWLGLGVIKITTVWHAGY